MQDVAGEALAASEKLIAASAAARISMKDTIQDVDRLEKDVIFFCLFVFFLLYLDLNITCVQGEDDER